jgi:hypothetical protein
MQTFTAAGQTWRLRITTLAAIKLKAAGIECGQIFTPAGLSDLGKSLDDPTTFGPLLWALIADQAQANNVTQAAFYEDLAGDTLDGAQAAFVEALIDFFPNAKAREAIRHAFRAKIAQQAEHLTRITSELVTD